MLENLHKLLKWNHDKSDKILRNVMNVVILKQKSEFQQRFFTKVGELDGRLVPKKRNPNNKTWPGYHNNSTKGYGSLCCKYNGDAAISLVYLYSFLCEKHSGTPEVHNPPQTFKKVTVKAAQTLSGRKQQHQAWAKGGLAAANLLLFWWVPLYRQGAALSRSWRCTRQADQPQEVL